LWGLAVLILQRPNQCVEIHVAAGQILRMVAVLVQMVVSN
jgi:hypothetical protein